MILQTLKVTMSGVDVREITISCYRQATPMAIIRRSIYRPSQASRCFNHQLSEVGHACTAYSNIEFDDRPVDGQVCIPLVI